MTCKLRGVRQVKQELDHSSRDTEYRGLICSGNTVTGPVLADQFHAPLCDKGPQ